MFGFPMFGFLTRAGDYEQRKVARYDGPVGFVSTARVTDSRHPYETGIQYNPWGDSVVIVEMYLTKGDAQKGHEKWQALMEAGTLPEKRPKDVGTSKIADLLRAVCGEEEEAA